MTTNAQVVQLFTDVLSRWNEREAEFRDWQAGTAEGGPNADGLYPLTNGSGETFLVACPAKLADTVSGPAVLSQAAKVAAEAAQVASEAARSGSTNSETLSSNHKAAALAARDLAKTYRDQCAAAQAAVASFQAVVLVKHDIVVAKAAEVEVFHGEVIAAKDDTLVARAAADVARDQAEAFAASINPAQLATKAELESELAALVGASPDTMNTLNEIAAALGDDPNFATTITASVAGKAPMVHGHAISDVAGLETALSGKQPVGNYVQTVSFTWDNVQGKPTTFAPSAHGHGIGEVSGLQTALDGKQPVGSYSLTNHNHADLYSVLGHGHSYSSLSGIPSTFAPSAHGHGIGEVSGLQTALDGKQPSGSYVTTAGFTWSALTGKPTLFPPEGHTHIIGGITGLQAALDSKQAVGSYAAVSHTHDYLPLAGGTLSGQLVAPDIQVSFSTAQTWASAVDAPWSSAPVEIFNANQSGAAYMSFHVANKYAKLFGYDEGGVLRTSEGYIFHSGNFDPASKANVSHGHVISEVTGLQSALDGKQPAGSYAAVGHNHTTLPNHTGTNNDSLQYWNTTNNTTLNPDPSYWYSLRFGHGDADTYYSATLSINFFSDVIKFRRKGGGSDQPWQELWHTANFNPATKADVGHTHDYLPLTGGSISGQLSANNGLYAMRVGYAPMDDIALLEGQSIVNYGMTQVGLPSFGGLNTVISGYSGLALVTSGQTRLAIRGDGNVGIGTNNPGAKLDVNGDLKANGTVRVFGAASERQIGFNMYGVDKYNLYMNGATDADRMDIRRGTTTVATFDASGNVGIGTSSPSYPLDVQRSDGFWELLRLKTTATGASALITATGGGGGAVDFGSGAEANTFVVRTAFAERMRVTATGELLVGRAGASGLGKLNVEGGADFTGGNVYLARDTGNVGIGTSGGLNFNAKLRVIAPSNQTVAEFYGAGVNNRSQIALTNDNWLAGVSSVNGDLVLQSGGLVDRCWLNSIGQFGIGVVPSGYQLQVAGNSKFRDVHASRGDGTGVVYLNEANTRYLFFDGSKYNLQGAELNVNGVDILTTLNAKASNNRIDFLFNNSGQWHSFSTDFNDAASRGFGFHFVQDTINGPNTGAGQFYTSYQGLGADYGPEAYGMQMAVPRYAVNSSADKYLSFRLREGGNWQPWQKFSAGDSDKLGGVAASDIMTTLNSKMDLSSYQSITGQKIFLSTGDTGGNSPALQAASDGSNAAFMSFHRRGSYAINMGLDSDNVFRIGGWSANAGLMQLTMGGAVTFAGGLTAGGVDVLASLNNKANVSHSHSAGSLTGVTVSTAAPSGGSDGDIWYKVAS